MDERSGLTVAEFTLQPLNDFMSHKAFRQGFMIAAIPVGLPGNFGWRTQQRYYANIAVSQMKMHRQVSPH
jgi:hypothetical protein